MPRPPALPGPPWVGARGHADKQLDSSGAGADGQDAQGGLWCHGRLAGGGSHAPLSATRTRHAQAQDTPPLPPPQLGVGAGHCGWSCRTEPLGSWKEGIQSQHPSVPRLGPPGSHPLPISDLVLGHVGLPGSLFILPDALGAPCSPGTLTRLLPLPTLWGALPSLSCQGTQVCGAGTGGGTRRFGSPAASQLQVGAGSTEPTATLP